MTFTEIVNEVLGRCNLSSSEATTRVGAAVNRHYKRITSQLGMNTARFVTRSASMAVGVRTVTFLDIEKIDRVIDETTPTAIKVLTERGLHELRSMQPGSSAPTMWCTQNTLGFDVTILTDSVPEDTYDLMADGWTRLSDLVGTDVPVIPESFHDILTFYVLDEELLRKEKADLADRYKAKADKLFSDLQFHLADSPTYSTRQDDTSALRGVSGGSGGGSATDDYARKSINETITGHWTFDGEVALSNATALIRSTSTDGADAKSITLAGGGAAASTRGGSVSVYGNENAAPGYVLLQAGNVASSQLAFLRADGGSAMLIDGATGVVTFGYGVAFPAAHVTTWTPTIVGSGGSSGTAYSVQSGRVMKVGTKVTAWGEVVLSTLGTITTSAQIGGLPYTAANTLPQAGVISFWSAMTATFVTVQVFVEAATTKASLYGATAAATGLTALVQGNLSNTTRLIFRLDYEASS